MGGIDSSIHFSSRRAMKTCRPGEIELFRPTKIPKGRNLAFTSTAKAAGHNRIRPEDSQARRFAI